MTEDRNAALEALETLKKCAYKSPLDGIISLHGDIEVIAPHYGVLVLALERFLESQTGKKRQAAPEYSSEPEWFFRWIARGKAGYAGMTMEQCADMIWHSPENPYRENNPWANAAAPTPPDRGEADPLAGTPDGLVG